MMDFNTFARVILCLGVLILERESHNMISPILSEWDWVHNTLYTNNTSDGLMKNSQNTTLDSHLFDTESAPIHITAIIIFLVTPVVSFIFAPLSGYIADTVGYETSLLVGILLFLVMSVSFAFSEDFWEVLVARFLQGAASPFNTSISYATITCLFSQDTAMGKIVLGIAVSTNSFSFIGAALFGITYEYLGQQLCFLLLLLPPCVILLLLVSVLLVSNRVESSTKPSSQDTDSLSSSKLSSQDTGQDLLLYSSDSEMSVKEDDDHNTKQELSRSYCPDSGISEDEYDDLYMIDILKNYRIIILCGSMVLATLPKKCLDLTIGIWMSETFNSSPATVGMAMGVATIAVILGNVSGASISICFWRHVPLANALSLALSVVPIMLLPFSTNPYIVAICYFLNVYFFSMAKYWTVHLVAEIADRLYPRGRARVMNVLTAFMVTPAIIGPIIALILYNSVGFKYMCIILGPMGISYSVFLGMMHLLNSDNDTDVKVKYSKLND